MTEYEQYKDICSRAANLYVEINKIYLMPVNVYMALYVKSISLEKARNIICTFFILHEIYQSIFHIEFEIAI